MSKNILYELQMENEVLRKQVLELEKEYWIKKLIAERGQDK